MNGHGHRLDGYHLDYGAGGFITSAVVECSCGRVSVGASINAALEDHDDHLAVVVMQADVERLLEDLDCRPARGVVTVDTKGRT